MIRRGTRPRGPLQSAYPPCGLQPRRVSGMRISIRIRFVIGAQPREGGLGQGEGLVPVLGPNRPPRRDARVTSAPERALISLSSASKTRTRTRALWPRRRAASGFPGSRLHRPAPGLGEGLRQSLEQGGSAQRLHQISLETCRVGGSRDRGARRVTPGRYADRHPPLPQPGRCRGRGRHPVRNRREGRRTAYRNPPPWQFGPAHRLHPRLSPSRRRPRRACVG